MEICNPIPNSVSSSYNLFQKQDRQDLPNNKVLDVSKLNAFADDNLTVDQKLKFALGKVENIVGKGENAGYQHFPFSHNVFKRLLLWGR